MIRPALIIAALPIAVWMLHPTPAWPDTQVSATEPGEDDGSLAWIIHENRVVSGLPTTGTFAVTIEGHGTITGTIDNTTNAYCSPACPDTLVILDVPDGLAVVPSGVTTAEGARSVLRVFEAVGF